MELNLSLKATVFPVTLGEEKFEIREMSAAEREKYLDRTGIRIGGSGSGATIKKFEGFHAELLTKTLFRVSDGVAVAETEINGWPGSAVTTLFEKAQEVNRLSGEKKVETKNA